MSKQQYHPHHLGYGRGRGGAGAGSAGFYKNNFALDDNDYGDEDEDMNDYGADQYYAEDSDDVDDSGDAAQYYPPGAMFQGGQQQKMMNAAMKPQTAAQGFGAVNSTSGVPFYGQQNKQPMGGYGGAGAFGQAAPGGGFTYGMAAKGGNLFGPPGAGAQPALFQGGTQFGGAGAQAQNNPGLFQFGSVSQFGGIGGGSLFGGANAMAGAPSDDPYANIALDLNKVKKSEPPPKLYEHKTEEEKKKETAAKTAQVASSAATKSNLKKDDEKVKPSSYTASSAMDDAQKKRNVTFGKSTTYEVDAAEDESGEFQTKDVREGKGSPRPDGENKKIIGEKDLSDGRTEKEKIKEMLERQQREQMEEIQEMNQWKSKIDEGKKPLTVEDSVGDSSSSYVPKKKSEQQSSGSYESDDFEDVSASGSGSKSKLTYWPPKSNTAANMKIVSKDSDEYDPKAMDEYLKKQKQAGKKPAVATKDQSESSDKYDEDFESISRSNTGMPLPSPHGQKGGKQPFDYKQPAADYKNNLQSYIKKENKFIQTEEGKYSFIAPADIDPSSYKEWTLTQNLKDAESLIQDLKAQQAENKQKIYDVETQMKKKDVEFQTQRRDALNATETSKRLQDQLKDSIHKNNLYKIETEELIKQIDLADAKTREKEDDLKLCQAEYERKLKLQEERILFRQSKNEERGVYDLKHKHMVEREELFKKIEDQKEEIDYYNTKIAKIETENLSLRLGKDQNKKIKELEDEIQVLKSTTQQNNFRVAQVTTQSAALSKGKDLSKDEQAKLQREVEQLDLMLRGYQEESEKSLNKFKNFEREIKTLTEKLLAEQKLVKELQQKAILNQDKVYVEVDNEELDIDTVNMMGPSNAISQKQLQELHSQVQKLQNEKLDIGRDFNLKDGQHKAQINKIRDEKAAVEKQLYDTEFLLGERDREISKLRDEFISDKQSLMDQISDLKDKITFFRQNQKLLSEEDSQTQDQLKEMGNLKEKVKKLEEQARKAADLEKKCKLLEETIKAKNPNSIPMMLQAVKETSGQDKAEVSELKSKIKQLECQLDDKDTDYEKKLRTLRQESERIKDQYESKKGQSTESKKVVELEKELETTKNYFTKRIREIEEKTKYRVPAEKEKKLGAGKPPVAKAEMPQNIDNKQLEDAVDKLTKERNLLAQKVVNLETKNNQRRQSFTSNHGQTPRVDDKNYANNAIYSIGNLIKQAGDNKDSSLLLIEAALTCVEQLRSRDPQRNKHLSKLLLNLTQNLNQTSRIDDKVLNNLIDYCRPQLDPTPPQTQQDLKRRNSGLPEMNKDLFYPASPDGEDEVSLLEPPTQRSMSRPAKPAFSKPFTADEQSGRNVREVMRVIAEIDFERLVQEKGLNSKSVPVNELYMMIQEESVSITVDEVKSVIKFIKNKSGVASQRVGGQDSCDINDLVNALMDVSIDMLGANKQQLNETGPSNRYSDNGNKNKLDQYAIQQAVNEKTDRLQRINNDLQSEKRSLQEKVDKLEQGKDRMEKILKSSLNKNGKDSNSDLIDELQILMKRIEYMEQQSDERSKSQYLDHNICNRQIQQLQKEIELEKNDKIKLLAKKNSEVTYFKAELDSLLSEIQRTSIR